MRLYGRIRIVVVVDNPAPVAVTESTWSTINTPPSGDLRDLCGMLHEVARATWKCKSKAVMALTQPLAMKIVTIGDGAVGKTCLLHAYTYNSFPEEYEPTVFDNYSCSILVDGMPMTLFLWDTAGQEEYDRLRPLSYPQTDCFLVCFSLCNPASLHNLTIKWIPEIKLAAPNAKIVICGTKSDLHGSEEFAARVATANPLRTAPIFVDEEEAKALAARNGAQYVACSALTGHNLKAVFDTCVRSVIAPPPPPPLPKYLAAARAMVKGACSLVGVLRACPRVTSSAKHRRKLQRDVKLMRQAAA